MTAQPRCVPPNEISGHSRVLLVPMFLAQDFEIDQVHAAHPSIISEVALPYATMTVGKTQGSSD